ncbi:hypothetical protein ACH5RR_000752 [Cinchona calisaya]|uniref:Uncharacterized protein n=1 Tax=Cinchona calisaya TaxID=153742 RepID=A0ABD3B1T7_9GENT
MEPSAPELISAMAGGWNAKLIIEVWTNIGGVAAIKCSTGLAVVAHRSGGRHVCILAAEKSGHVYICAMKNNNSPKDVSLPEVMVGESEELMKKLIGIDFIVVDGICNDFGQLGAVIICKSGSSVNFHVELSYDQLKNAV